MSALYYLALVLAIVLWVKLSVLLFVACASVLVSAHWNRIVKMFNSHWWTLIIVGFNTKTQHITSQRLGYGNRRLFQCQSFDMSALICFITFCQHFTNTCSIFQASCVCVCVCASNHSCFALLSVGLTSHHLLNFTVDWAHQTA